MFNSAPCYYFWSKLPITFHVESLSFFCIMSETCHFLLFILHPGYILKLLHILPVTASQSRSHQSTFIPYSTIKISVNPHPAFIFISHPQPCKPMLDPHKSATRINYCDPLIKPICYSVEAQYKGLCASHSGFLTCAFKRTLNQ